MESQSGFNIFIHDQSSKMEKKYLLPDVGQRMSC